MDSHLRSLFLLNDSVVYGSYPTFRFIFFFYASLAGSISKGCLRCGVGIWSGGCASRVNLFLLIRNSG